MKIEENHYNYRIETKDPNGGSLDFIDIDTVEPLRCAYDVQDELNLETNEHIKRVEEIVLDANSTEFWYVDEARTSDTHLVCYFEEVQLMAHKDHSMVDTNRSVFEYGKINSNEHQNTNFICTHVMDNGVSRLYMSIDKETFEFATFNNETIKHFISNNPVTVWYALRYEVIIPRSMSKGHLLTLGGQTDITLTTTSEQAKLPIMKFNIGDTQYTLDGNPIHINNTQEGTQIRNIVLEGNTPINYARGNGVNTTEQVSNTRYDFAPFYDGQATIQGTVEGGYVSAKLYGDTMVNIAKPYGETPLLTATNTSTLCDDLLGTNEEGIVLADGEITEGRIYGDSSVVDNTIQSVVNPTVTSSNVPNYFMNGNVNQNDGSIAIVENQYYSVKMRVPTSTFIFDPTDAWAKIAYYDENDNFIKCDYIGGLIEPITSTPPENASYVRYGQQITSNNSSDIIGVTWKYEDGTDVYPELETRFITTRTLNKLPNGVADYIDVVNKVHVQRVGKVVLDGSTNEIITEWSNDSWGFASDVAVIECKITNLKGYQDNFTISTIADKIPSLTWYDAFRDGTSDIDRSEGVTPYTNSRLIILLSTSRISKSSTLEEKLSYLQSNPITVLYELATPVYTPLTEEEIAQLPLSAYSDGYVNLSSDQLMPSFEFRMRASNRYQVDMLETGYYYLNAPVGSVKLGTANVNVQQMPCIVKVDNVGSGDSGYRLGFDGEVLDTTKITLAKLPSHRIPTSFTQGMKCGTDFGYWEGVKSATGKELYANETNKLNFAPIELNRIEYSNIIVEDEFDIATGKLTKRIGKYTIDGNSRVVPYSYTNDTALYKAYVIENIPNMKQYSHVINFIFNKGSRLPQNAIDEECWQTFTQGSIYFRCRKDRYSQYGDGADGVKAYFNANPTTIYYELEVPEISYISLPLNEVKTVGNSTLLQLWRADITHLNPQIKPSHLTYPVPSLVGNRTYTVVHNRKNISGSTKPIELNLGGTVVQLNDASSKTLVKTPSTLAHSNLIFIGGESTVDHIMVLDGDWTNKPIEYFENMKGHDTDAIITIIGDGQIDDVEEQYLW